jgi:PTH1 family peptidyl-tRNA hydrolase
MSYIIVGLGNPGTEYAHTRHNTGRLAENYINEGGKVKAKFIFPDTFMNKSGSAVSNVVKNKKDTEKLIVLHDDLDLPLGSLKVSFNRSSGGHRGVESIIRALKTEAFTRIRIGISPVTPSGKMKKPKGEKEVDRHILSQFKKSEEEILKKVFKRANDAVTTIVEEGREKAMNKYN